MSDNITRADGTVLHSGYMTAKPNKSAKKFKAAASSLPPRVDLRPQMTAVEDQGQIGSCVANATAGAVEHLIKVTQGVNYDVSRLFIYYNARAYDGNEREDAGTYEESAVRSLEEYGVCAESLWPYKDTKKALAAKPSKTSYSEAKKFRIKEYQQVETSLKAWKSALAEGHPIIFGMLLFDSFDRQRRPGLVPMPSAREAARESHAGHAMLCVGYSDPDRLFIVRNSWGRGWGDNGYCYIPYDYLMNEDYNGGDSWVIYSADPIDTSKIEEEAWSDEEDSVVPDVETAFSDMDDETWEALCDECGDYDVIYRIGGLYVSAACMDEDFSDEEQDEAAKHLQKIINYFGVKMNAKKVIANCLELAQDEEFLTSTMVIFAKYLTDPLKLAILNDMIEITGSDGLDSEEEGFINDMAEIFDIEEGTEAMELDDDEDYSEYYDDDEDEEYDEEEEYDEDCECDEEEEEEEESISLEEALAPISQKEWDKICRKMGDYDFPTRLAFLLNVCVNIDNASEDAFSDAIGEICDYFELDGEELLDSFDEDLDIDDTLEIFKRLPEALRGKIAMMVCAIIEGCDEDGEECSYIAESVNSWF